MSGKLSDTQRARLKEIAEYQPRHGFRHIGFWKSSSTDRSLLKRGLIERVTEKSEIMSGISAEFYCCRLTASGRAALSDRRE